MKTAYDKSTDSLYIEVRPLPCCRSVEIQEDIIVDIGSDGQPIGYDIQPPKTTFRMTCPHAGVSTVSSCE